MKARRRGHPVELIRPKAPAAARCSRCAPSSRRLFSERYAPERWDAHQAMHDRLGPDIKAE